jgi:hypothetical protein
VVTLNHDGYVRIGPAGPILGAELSGPEPLIFLDAQTSLTPQLLRRVPHTYFASARLAVLRGTTEDLDTLQELLGVIGKRIPCVRLKHRVGQAPKLQIRNAAGQAVVGDEIADRCRVAELRSMLEMGEAIWESKNFHFLLPSGRHARTFVRPAHAIRSARDAHVVALWLLEHIRDTGTGVLVDSNSLTAVILALQLELKCRDVALGPVEVLEGYPSTAFDAEASVRRVTEEFSSVLGIVSVSGTGTVREHMVRSMRDLYPYPVENAAVVTLFDVAPQRPQPRGAVSRVSLIHLGDSRYPRRFESHDGPCMLCDDANTAPLVPVDVDTFDVRFPAFVVREMPHILDPQRNRALWEACDNQRAFRFEAEPDRPVQIWRPTDKMSWKVDWDALIQDKDFSARARVRIEEEVKAWNGEAATRHEQPDNWDGFDLILVPEHDLQRPGSSELYAELRKVLTGPDPVAFPEQSDWPASLTSAVLRARRILVLSLGTVTGTTVQRALNEIQRTRTDANYDLFGVVVHARPSRRRTWEVLSNSYARRLIAGFLSYLPDDYSPLADEDKAFSLDASSLSQDEGRFLEHRRSVCKGEDGDASFGFLWGAAPDEKISPHSIFGDRLSAKATFVAVGSALHARREALRNPPYRTIFEMPAIARSYYDPVIFVCMLRWLRRPEIWWGATLAQGELVVAEVLQRASDKQRPLLLGEFLLASAQGKLPARGVDRVVVEAEALLGTGDAETRAMLSVGLRLLGKR